MTLLFGFAAVNTGNNLLYLMVSAMLGFMAVTGIFGWLNIRRLRLSISFPDEIYSGTETVVTLLLEGSGIFPSFLIRVDLFGQHIDYPVVERRGTVSTPFVTVFTGRGSRQAEACRVSSIFPVNFFMRSKTYWLDEQFVVFPQLIPTSTAAAAGAGAEGGSEIPISGFEGDLLKIGDYTGTEPRKLIHWRLSAKHGRLKVKGLSALSAEPAILDPGCMPGAGMEERLSRTAYLINRLIGERRPVGLRIGDRLLAPSLTRYHRLMLLRELAMYDRD